MIADNNLSRQTRRHREYAPEERRLSWKKVKKTATQITAATAVVYWNMSNALTGKTAHPSAKPVSETVLKSVRYNP